MIRSLLVWPLLVWPPFVWPLFVWPLFVGTPLVLAGAASSAPADATAAALVDGGHVRLRVHTEPARLVAVGQQTRLFVEILTDTWFTQAPSYPELTLEGAIALMPEQLGTNFTERIDGTTFAAQRRGYVIYPQRAGTLALPPIPVRLAVSVDAKSSPPFTLTTPPLRLQVVLPVETEGLSTFVTTPDLEVEETWSRGFEGLEVGDALERTVRMRASDSLGMLLPELSFEAPPGIALYPAQPRATDRVNRGQYRGERVESATYVLQREGEFTLPEVRVHAWNPEAGSLETRKLEARTFEVSASSVPEAAALSPAERGPDLGAIVDDAIALVRAHGRALLAAAAALALLGWGLRRYGPRFLAAARARVRRARHSEAARFRALRRAVRGGDADAVVRAYWAWRDRLEAEPAGVTAAEVHEAAERSGFALAWARFEAARYAASADAWDPAGLGRAFAQLRATLRGAAGEARRAGTLNPRG